VSHLSTAALSASLLLALAALPACGDDTSGSGGGEPGDGGAGGTTGEGGAGGSAATAPAATAIGEGDASRVQLVDVYTDDDGRLVTDIDVHPLRDELWVLLREPYSGAPCNEDVRSGCFALQGSTATVTGPASGAPTAEWKQDENAWHFMRRPTGIAFGDDDTFATIHEFRTGNYDDEPADFIGPTLWSGDPAIYAEPPPPGKNGSHLDMLHETPFGMGIAHETANVYWTFNGQIGALDRYDFALPHEIGGDDHSDGTVHRYVEGQLLRVEEVPSHLELDRSTGWLYVADTGHGRVVRLDITSGTFGSTWTPLERMVIAQNMDGATLEEVVPPGILQQPSGLAIAGEGASAVLYVGDHATGEIVAFDTAGAELARFATSLPGLTGLALGPDGSLYAASYDEGRVVRLAVTP
jgi:hypothetical protein